MHELSLAEGALEVALRHARQAGAGRVAALHLVVGEFTPLDATSFEFYWERLAQGTAAEGARLNVRRVAARVTCDDCGAEADLGSTGRGCPRCGGSRQRLSTGAECYLESIDVDDGPP